MKKETSIKTMEFKETPIEYIVKNGIKYISIKSIGSAIGIDSDTIRKVISRNKESFEDFSTSDMLSGEGGKRRKQVCLSRDGIIGLMFMLNIDMYPEKIKSNIIEFKKWAILALGFAYDRQFGNLVMESKEEQRDITKSMHKALMPALTDIYAPRYDNGVVPRTIYMKENIMLNNAAFGYHERGIRDKVTHEELVRLAIAQGSDLAMVERGIVDLYDRKNTIDNVINKYYIPAESKPSN